MHWPWQALIRPWLDPLFSVALVTDGNKTLTGSRNHSYPLGRCPFVKNLAKVAFAFVNPQHSFHSLFDTQNLWHLLEECSSENSQCQKVYIMEGTLLALLDISNFFPNPCLQFWKWWLPEHPSGFLGFFYWRIQTFSPNCTSNCRLKKKLHLQIVLTSWKNG